jgi:hypothetical protein
MAFAAAEAFFIAEAKDEDLLALDIAHHTRAHAGTFDERAAYPNRFVAADQQYFIKLNFAPWFGAIEEREVNLLPLLNPILHPTIPNDCVHVSTPSASGNTAEAGFSAHGVCWHHHSTDLPPCMAQSRLRQGFSHEKRGGACHL